jgi:hypothetical protein
VKKIVQFLAPLRASFIASMSSFDGCIVLQPVNNRKQCEHEQVVLMDNDDHDECKDSQSPQSDSTDASSSFESSVQHCNVNNHNQQSNTNCDETLEQQQQYDNDDADVTGGNASIPIQNDRQPQQRQRKPRLLVRHRTQQQQQGTNNTESDPDSDDPAVLGPLKHVAEHEKLQVEAAFQFQHNRRVLLGRLGDAFPNGRLGLVRTTALRVSGKSWSTRLVCCVKQKES